ncbi:MAG: type II toxin-antitoxin system HicA family toxin [Bacteroidetes bacterium]|nr:type II toxin-antitoxin system HicA family toxin [Bacteroidota bacterium]
MKVKEVLKILTNDGWFLVPQRGSHKQYKHPNKNGLVTVAGHKESDEIAIGTLRSIFKQAQIEIR